ncbi:hypothetical protein Salat_0754800 [Sesamum alatum]|uniref:Uncharacterized protein n=1 Tax=Sesamum alatum TaxID=300844 RepID=A0AAE1YTI9_9LAMI|nr:hypothetical protein Salat_0754800 [Sesamum alatum]
MECDAAKGDSPIGSAGQFARASGDNDVDEDRAEGELRPTQVENVQALEEVKAKGRHRRATSVSRLDRVMIRSVSHVFKNCTNKIWFLDRAVEEVELLVDDEHSLYLCVTASGFRHPLLCTIIYGNCGKVARLAIWSFIMSIGEQRVLWLIRGDFNSVVSVSERSNGTYPMHHSIEEFSEEIFDCGLVDLGF